MNENEKRSYAARIKNKLVRDIALQPPSHTDPNGSYTGKPLGGGEPVQDADDL